MKRNPPRRFSKQEEQAILDDFLKLKTYHAVAMKHGCYPKNVQRIVQKHGLISIFSRQRKHNKLSINTSGNRVISLSKHFITRLGFDIADDNLYGEWKIVRHKGKKALLLQVKRLENGHAD